MIFRKLFKRRRSGTIARERLQILLVTDRIGCNPNTTEAIKNDIINTISKYIDIDVENCIVEIKNRNALWQAFQSKRLNAKNVKYAKKRKNINVKKSH